jgi:putative transposase
MDTIRKLLEPEKYYHIYNRGVNGENIFFEERNYHFFLQKYTQYVYPFIDTFAYCLLKNHFHLLIRVKTEKEIRLFLNGKKEDKTAFWHVSNAFSSLFQSYSQAINKRFDRTGSLFESPFHRIEVDNEDYFTQLVWYIHHNPQKHGFVSDFRDYPYSSYWSHLQEKYTKLERQEVLDWFGNNIEYEKFHLLQNENKSLKDIIIGF